MFSRIRLVLAQTREYADRFIHLGCRPDRVIVTSSLKYDTAQILDTVPGAQEMSRQLHVESEPVWVAGGTGDGEEAMILRVFSKLKTGPAHAGLRLMLIPRKPERFNEVAELIRSMGLSVEKYSRIKSGQVRLENKTPIILGDTMGDLRKFYCLSSGPVFVGRTLVPMGGSDMMEPAALGKCVLFGPHTFNFRQTVEALLAGQGAIEVQDEGELFSAMERCLADPAYVQHIAANGRRVIADNQGATGKTVAAIREALGV
jgi:3-deoxy-D-manno-octulosonic-acid transferase